MICTLHSRLCVPWFSRLARVFAARHMLPRLPCSGKGHVLRVIRGASFRASTLYARVKPRLCYTPVMAAGRSDADARVLSSYTATHSADTAPRPAPEEYRDVSESDKLWYAATERTKQPILDALQALLVPGLPSRPLASKHDNRCLGHRPERPDSGPSAAGAKPAGSDERLRRDECDHVCVKRTDGEEVSILREGMSLEAAVSAVERYCHDFSVQDRAAISTMRVGDVLQVHVPCFARLATLTPDPQDFSQFEYRLCDAFVLAKRADYDGSGKLDEPGPSGLVLQDIGDEDALIPGHVTRHIADPLSFYPEDIFSQIGLSNNHPVVLAANGGRPLPDGFEAQFLRYHSDQVMVTRDDLEAELVDPTSSEAVEANGGKPLRPGDVAVECGEVEIIRQHVTPSSAGSAEEASDAGGSVGAGGAGVGAGAGSAVPAASSNAVAEAGRSGAGKTRTDHPIRVLEVASGTGQHAAFFCGHLPQVRWTPTDIDPALLRSIVAHTAEVPNCDAPLALDVASDWAVDGAAYDVVFNSNMLHVAPPELVDHLLRGAAHALRPGGLLLAYGPFKEWGTFNTDSNRRFDAGLRARNASWGVRDIKDLDAAGDRHGLTREVWMCMPSNNVRVLGLGTHASHTAASDTQYLLGYRRNLDG